MSNHTVARRGALLDRPHDDGHRRCPQSFYADLFGWTAEVGGPEYGGYINVLQGRHPRGRLHGERQGSQGPDPNVWSIYLASEDTRATATPPPPPTVPPSLVEPMDIPAVGVMAFLVDPGGAAIGVFQGTGEMQFGYDLQADGTPGWFELHRSRSARPSRSTSGCSAGTPT